VTDCVAKTVIVLALFHIVEHDMKRILTELFFFFLIILSAKTAYALKKDKRKPPQSPLTGGNKMRRLT